MKILLGYQSYGGESKSAVGQRLCNMYAEKNPDIAGVTASAHKGMQFMVGSKYPWTLFGTPGQKLWCDLGTNTAIQGMQTMGGLLYAVSGNKVFKITTGGVATNIDPDTSMTSANGNVDIANNGTQMAIVSDDGTGWVATSSDLVKITDGDFPGSVSSVCYLQGFGIFSTTDSQQFQISASYDMTSYVANYASVISSASNLIRVSAFNNGLFLWTGTSYEVWGNNGASPIPYQIISSDSNSTRGLAGKFGIAQDANSQHILADDGIVYSFIGFQPQRISHHAVETAIQSYKDNFGISDVVMNTYTQRGHKFLVMTFPAAQATWVYDITQGLWHERFNLNSKRWNPNCIVAFGGKILVGDFANGKIYELDNGVFTDDGNAIQRIAQGAVTWEEASRITHDMVRLDIDTGVGLDGGPGVQGSDPQVIMQYSDDGGNKWSNERWQSIGKQGQYKNQCIWRRNGSSRQRIYRFMITDPVDVRINGAYADVRIGHN